MTLRVHTAGPSHEQVVYGDELHKPSANFLLKNTRQNPEGTDFRDCSASTNCVIYCNLGIQRLVFELSMPDLGPLCVIVQR